MPDSIASIGSGTSYASMGAELAQYMLRANEALQKRATVAGMRAYMSVLRRRAAADSPFAAFRKPGAYRGSVKGKPDGSARGTLASAGVGNILESGARAHWAPMDPREKEEGGPQSPGLRAWLAANAPQVLAAVGDLPFLYLAARTGKPWVIPTQESADAEATEAFETAAFRVLDEVK